MVSGRTWNSERHFNITLFCIVQVFPIVPILTQQLWIFSHAKDWERVSSHTWINSLIGICFKKLLCAKWSVSVTKKHESLYEHEESRPSHLLAIIVLDELNTWRRRCNEARKKLISDAIRTKNTYSILLLYFSPFLFLVRWTDGNRDLNSRKSYSSMSHAVAKSLKINIF